MKLLLFTCLEMEQWLWRADISESLKILKKNCQQTPVMIVQYYEKFFGKKNLLRNSFSFPKLF